MFVLVLLQFTVVPDAELNVIALTIAPVQTTWLLPPPPEVIDTVGVGFTVISIESFLVQPLLPVAVTTYSVVAVGVAITGVPLGLLKLTDGDHVHDIIAPVTERVELPPIHICWGRPRTLISGGKLTVTVALVAELPQPAIVPVTL